MRTDSVTLSTEAMTATRDAITSEYGQNHLSPQPKVYTSKSKNAQEAHEAVRPVTPYRSPKQVEGELNSQELALYRLIWQRTLASQMADATGVTVSVRLGAVSEHEQTDCEFSASGTTITFPGYRAVYVAADDDGDGTKEALLPPLAQGEVVPVESLTPNGHTTSPPARYTEASLVKRLEELEIGRPSTWASIIQTIQDRGYVWKKGQALVPTWTAFAVVGLLEQHFTDLVDYELTAKMDDDLDAIANGDMQKDVWLQRFYFGDDESLPGLKQIVEENLDKIDAAAINTFPLGHDENGELVVAKPGKYGPYVKRGDDTASVPDDMPPDELDVAKALELLALPKSDEPIGEMDGYPVYAKSGRFGPYVVKDKDFRSIDSEEQLLTITLDEAARIFALPKVFKRGGRNMAAKGPLREFGTDPVSERPVVAKDGRFGIYVTDGETNASIGKGDRIEEITPERAYELIAIRREAVAAKGGATKKKPARKKAAAKKRPAKKKAVAKKAAAKKTT
jgi:DNA topoisomerase-1